MSLQTKLTMSIAVIPALFVTTHFLSATSAPTPATAAGGPIPLKFNKIYWEYNASANDLGVHVSLDGEDWKSLEIENPLGKVIFEVEGSGPYKTYGMTELFFEGAEPSLDEVPLSVLLGKFPQGNYEFSGLDVSNHEIESVGKLSHAIPAGPQVLADIVGNSFLRIHWSAVKAPPPGFPKVPVNVVAYQVIVEKFQVTVPATTLSLTVSPEFVAALPKGVHQFEVLAIEASGNQTLTEGSFVKK